MPSADGQSVYVGGDFRTINSAGPARLQKLSLADGSKVGAFEPISSRVYDVKLNGNTLYVSGSFKTVGGVDRRGFATLDATTGALTDKVNLPFTGTARGGVSGVRKIDVTPSGDRLIAIGNFNAVAGSSRVQIAMLNLQAPTATLDTWSSSAFTGSACGTSFDTYMHDVDLSPDGSFFVVVTTGGPGGTSKMCDSASRWETYAGAASTPTWMDYTGGDTFWAVEVTGPVAYVGGHFRWLNNPSGRRHRRPGAYSRVEWLRSTPGTACRSRGTQHVLVALVSLTGTSPRPSCGPVLTRAAGPVKRITGWLRSRGKAGYRCRATSSGPSPAMLCSLTVDNRQTGVRREVALSSRRLVAPATVSLGTAGTDWSRTFVARSW